MPRCNPTIAGRFRQDAAALMRVPACLAVLLILLSVTASGQEYVVGEGDLLKISVYGNPDLTTEVRVTAHDMITVPLVGEVSVKGLTATGIGRKLAGLYADGYLRNPQVSVFIGEYRSKKVTTLGEFNKPGLIEMRGDSTLMEVISNAGGITSNAGDTLYIKRNSVKPGEDAKQEITLSIDLTRLMESPDASTNIQVLDGDSIYVPRAAYVYVTGEVKTPGAYKITRGLTVLRSVTLAGGLTQRANPDRIDIVRKTAGAEKTLKAAMDEMVQPEDVIVVHESFF